jgi:hypothetical protein
MTVPSCEKSLTKKAVWSSGAALKGGLAISSRRNVSADRLVSTPTTKIIVPAARALAAAAAAFVSSLGAPSVTINMASWTEGFDPTPVRLA